jgi:hypothetical protein
LITVQKITDKTTKQKSPTLISRYWNKCTHSWTKICFSSGITWERKMYKYGQKVWRRPLSAAAICPPRAYNPFSEAISGVNERCLQPAFSSIKRKLDVRRSNRRHLPGSKNLPAARPKLAVWKVNAKSWHLPRLTAFNGRKLWPSAVWHWRFLYVQSRNQWKQI